MSAARRVVRALLHRPVTALMTLLLAVVASAVASISPTYYATARNSILADELHSGPVVQRGFEIARQGLVGGTLSSMSHGYQAALAQTIPSAEARARLLPPPIEAIEATAVFSSINGSATLAWRSDFCTHVHVVVGLCPGQANQVAVSESAARANAWHVGQTLAANGWPPLVITGVYAIPDFTNEYWFNRGGVYFPAEAGDQPLSAGAPPPIDAIFTVRETVDTSAEFRQGSVVFDQLIDVDHVRAGDLGALETTVDQLGSLPELGPYDVSTDSTLAGAVDHIRVSWRSLAITEFLVGIQLMTLVWLLMFLVVKDAIEARGVEIALMKLRGFRGFRLLRFALGEVVTLLFASLPLGMVVGWLVTGALARWQLRPGTSVVVPVLAWGAACVATIGGLVAAAAAAVKTVRRPVVEEWRRTAPAHTRGWVIDAVLVTGAVAGLVALRATGQVTSIGHGSLGLLEPGLLGLAIAVVASRVLPAICRGAFGLTRRRGGLGTFLAVRHIARRPGGARTTIILGTAFALAIFGVLAWSTGKSNREEFAQASVGAPTVYTVVPPPDKELGSIVEAIDPGGRRAAVVDTYNNGGNELLAVDANRFAHVANWRAHYATLSLPDLARKLTPDAAPPVRVDGDRIRIRLDVEKLSDTGLVLQAELGGVGGSIPVQFTLGPIVKQGHVVLTADLGRCSCGLRHLSLSPATTAGANTPINGAIVINGIDVNRDNTWSPIANVTKPTQWRGDGSLTSVPGGLRWSFQFLSRSEAVLNVADVPEPIPAVASASAVGDNPSGTVETFGLDGQTMAVKPLAVASVIPGATTSAVIVDRTYATRAAGGYLSGSVTQQVWVAEGAARQLETGLKNAGVRIVEASSSAAQAQLLDRQGAGLAGTTLLADSLAGAVLAAGAAVMGLVVAGRRRRYEYEALIATGASRRTLRSGLLIEQAAVLLFGAIAGIVAGLLAALLVLRSIPEFVTPPESFPLRYVPDGGVLSITVALTICTLLVVAILASAAMVTGLRGERLREAAP